MFRRSADLRSRGPHLAQFILHAAMDPMEEQIVHSNANFLRARGGGSGRGWEGGPFLLFVWYLEHVIHRTQFRLILWR